MFRFFHFLPVKVKPDTIIVVGMFVNAKIEVANTQALAVPSESIVQFDEKFYVFTLNKNAMEN